MKRPFWYIAGAVWVSVVSFVTPGDVQAETETVEACTDGGEYHDWNAQREEAGSRSYDELVVEPRYSGSVLYDEELASTDFSATQSYTYDMEAPLYTERVPEDDPPDDVVYVCYEADEFQGYETTQFNIEGEDTLPGSAIDATESGSRPDGTTTVNVEATANGETGTYSQDVHWVTDVDIDAGDEHILFEDDGSTPLNPESCTLTYGNGVTRDCSEGEMDWTESVRDNDSTSDEIADEMAAEVAGDEWLEFQDMHNAETQRNATDEYEGRIDEEEYEQMRNRYNRVGEMSGGPPQVEEGMLISRVATSDSMTGRGGPGDGWAYSYVDEYTGAGDVDSKMRWYVSHIDVEDETREPTKKEVYGHNREWSDHGDNQELSEVPVDENVTCTRYYYGPFGSEDCMDEVEIETDSEFHSSWFDQHPQYPVDSMKKVFTGGSSTLTRSYSDVEYKIGYSDGANNISADDYRTIVLAEEIEVNDYRTYHDDPASDVGTIRHENDNSPHQVTVLETHERGEATPSTTSTHEGFSWSANQEEYENEPEQPSCQVTYHPSVTGEDYVHERDCSDDMMYFFETDGSRFFEGEWGWDYDYGDGFREARWTYRENNLQADQYEYYYYATDLDIEFSDSGTNEQREYQDEPYSDMTCTRDYPGYEGDHVVIQDNARGSFENDCTDTMYIENDTGQNQIMNQEREVDFEYVHNDHSADAFLERVYAVDTTIDEPATEGRTGYRGDYYCDVNWQDTSSEDVSYEEEVWTSQVASSGEKVNYIGETWNGFTDAKGQSHSPDSINQFYITDPVSKEYQVDCQYPHDSYNNDLRPGWTYLSDDYAPGVDDVPFNLIGHQDITLTAAPHNSLHDVDTHGMGQVDATPYEGSSESAPPSDYPMSETMAFNNTTYQTGHWYDFAAEVTYDDGGTEVYTNVAERPEISWQSLSGETFTTDTDYPVAGTNTGFPDNSIDHRLNQDYWNGVKFDLFSTSDMRTPSGQENYRKGETYEEAFLFSHSPTELLIGGQSVITDIDATYDYDAYLQWSDGDTFNQDDGSVISPDMRNPWGQGDEEPYRITNQTNTTWAYSHDDLVPSDWQGHTNPLQLRFDDFDGDNTHRTLAAEWGDDERTESPYGGQYEYWDYLHQEMTIRIEDEDGSCSGITSPAPNCDLPVDGEQTDNYRMPSNPYTDVMREVEKTHEFDVTGISQGSGYE
ncbi:hypothetical protein [Salisediminibacterium halotolerans]|uniref:hypothetical protein n=1 Tax=Salisediminibacterium halotolerans TaxID=517425 RepID=UPI000EAC257D|nr:hypothetical protein [Salisediminibacterium halotolerans]RLJ72204.1 hypothetical protein BCL39_2096 [Actinophytocola xinjiangensis]RPE85417.1 hypothetical protein EDD67_2231 [Salisediminibacterium halotolerans]TWG33374.1 hypothetical protein BCL52_2093 [Salisediminibacterium halotolerans]GEL07096.1 hypothetical protein SHA02_05120 [Salisediminibacterium halotolerans]